MGRMMLCSIGVRVRSTPSECQTVFLRTVCIDQRAGMRCSTIKLRRHTSWELGPSVGPLKENFRDIDWMLYEGFMLRMYTGDVPRVFNGIQELLELINQWRGQIIDGADLRLRYSQVPRGVCGDLDREVIALRLELGEVVVSLGEVGKEVVKEDGLGLLVGEADAVLRRSVSVPLPDWWCFGERFVVPRWSASRCMCPRKWGLRCLGV